MGVVGSACSLKSLEYLIVTYLVTYFLVECCPTPPCPGCVQVQAGGCRVSM